MKERLIELLKAMNATPEITCPRFNNRDCKGCRFDKGDACDVAGREADYLIKNGVFAPPCNVGQTVYSLKGCFFIPYEKDINPNEVIPCEVIAIKETKKGKYILLKPLLIETYSMRSANKWFPFSAIGKTVFLTREEAEKKLKERKEDEGE